MGGEIHDPDRINLFVDHVFFNIIIPVRGIGIIAQFQAAKAALDNTFSLVLQRNLKQCMSQDDSKSVERILQLIAK